ncbi:MAG TPA: bis(5'-nucleosyl)-tetraphosphatase (symmetrical) YqeK [Dehalococcoidia bacterium]|nr:bis(5'-nucleosyl)-tetraphosphatase (symmetrical) YqeK [Dehalococcoidia bacterium]
MSLEDQIAAVRGELLGLPVGLQTHVERVATEALELGRYWDLDPLRVELAVWGHDLFRAVPESEQIALAEGAGVKVRRADRETPIVLHAPTAAAALCDRFGVKDGEVLDAVAQHTLGARTMPMLSKVLLLADKVEPGKRNRHPEMWLIRELARRDLDLALLCWADWKWVQERTNGWHSHSAHWKARRHWVKAHHKETKTGVR